MIWNNQHPRWYLKADGLLVGFITSLFFFCVHWGWNAGPLHWATVPVQQQTYLPACLLAIYLGQGLINPQVAQVELKHVILPPQPPSVLGSQVCTTIPGWLFVSGVNHFHLYLYIKMYPPHTKRYVKQCSWQNYSTGKTTTTQVQYLPTKKWILLYSYITWQWIRNSYICEHRQS